MSDESPIRNGGYFPRVINPFPGTIPDVLGPTKNVCEFYEHLNRRAINKGGNADSNSTSNPSRNITVRANYERC